MDKAQTNPGPVVVKAPVSTPTPKTDRYGDPLPAGAAMRLGTVRFRQTPFDPAHRLFAGRPARRDGRRHSPPGLGREDGKKLQQIDVGIESVRDFAFSPDGKRSPPGIPVRARAEPHG